MTIRDPTTVLLGASACCAYCEVCKRSAELWSRDRDVVEVVRGRSKLF